MIRLKSIHITGFKDPEEKKELVFSTEPITVIYGENGSGKTTLLKILFAILNRDEATLLRENVMVAVVKYTNGNEEKSFTVKRDEEGSISWGKSKDLYNSSSILFGVHRGITGMNLEKDLDVSSSKTSVVTRELVNITQTEHNLSRNEKTKLFNIIKKFKSSNVVDSSEIDDIFEDLREGTNFRPKILDRITNVFVKYISTNSDEFYNPKKKNKFLNNLQINNHLSTNFVQITDIQKAIINQYKEGQNIISNKVKTAFFETNEKAIDIDEKEDEFILPDNFDEKIEANKDFILKAIPVEDSSLTKRIKQYIETKDESLTENSKIFRAMLLEMIENAEEPNPELDSITKLIEMFNEHLYKNKKLVVTQDETYIELGNGKRHELEKLSSGERNLLSILTLFLIIGKNRNFLMIDEPEISLNMKWQREFLPLLSSLNSNAQIIVASHSPSIAHKNSNYLVELI